MKKSAIILAVILILSMFSGCTSKTDNVQIVATTLPVYEFTSRLCEGTELQVGQLVTENISCLHDYTLQVDQMRMIEDAEILVMNGGGLEEFLTDVIAEVPIVIDTSDGITLCESHHDNHNHHDHNHQSDPHFWLAPDHAITMVHNISGALSNAYPGYCSVFSANEEKLVAELEELQAYGNTTLHDLDCTALITFHDGFGYFAEAFDLTILESMEEESGSEASAGELIELIELIDEHQLPAVFTETNGSDAAASIIVKEAEISIFVLDMAMAGDSYFDAMYHNIDTVKEALG